LKNFFEEIPDIIKVVILIIAIWLPFSLLDEIVYLTVMIISLPLGIILIAFGLIMDERARKEGKTYTERNIWMTFGEIGVALFLLALFLSEMSD